MKRVLSILRAVRAITEGHKVHFPLSGRNVPVAPVAIPSKAPGSSKVIYFDSQKHLYDSNGRLIGTGC